MGKLNPVIIGEKTVITMVNQLQPMPQPRRMEQEPRKPVLRSGPNIYDLVWQDGVAYCEFQSPAFKPFRVQAKEVLDALHKMVDAQ